MLGRLLASLPGDGRPLRRAFIGPDGASLITLGSDRVLIWPMRIKPPGCRPPEKKTPDARIPDKPSLAIPPAWSGCACRPIDAVQATMAMDHTT
ncbi:MAG: hypothetical protein ACUVT2_02730 [Thiobacillaceae bacterium]